MAINLPQKPRTGFHAIQELTRAINGLIDYVASFLFSGDGVIKVNQSMFRADFSLDMKKLEKELRTEYSVYDGFFKVELVPQDFTQEEEEELDESGYYHGKLSITSGAPYILYEFSYIYLNGYRIQFYNTYDFGPVKMGFLCLYIRIDGSRNEYYEKGYVIENLFPENRNTSILKYPIAYIYKEKAEWKVFQIVRYEIPSLYLFDYTGSFVCSVFYKDENSSRSFHLLVSRGFPDQNVSYCGSYANADGSDSYSVSRQTLEIPSAGNYEARVYRHSYSGVRIELKNLDGTIPEIYQPTVEEYVTLARIVIPPEAYEIPSETEGVVLPSYEVTQIWKGGDIRKNNSFWRRSFRLEAYLSEDETQVFTRISDENGLTSGQVRIHYERDNRYDYLTINYPAGSVEVPLSGISAWILFHFEYNDQRTPELSVTGEALIVPEIRYDATNIWYGNYIKPSYSHMRIGQIPARNQFSDTVNVRQFTVVNEYGQVQKNEDRYKQGPEFLCDFIRTETRRTAQDGALEITETATGIRCRGGNLYQSGIRTFEVGSQDLELRNGSIIVFLKYDYENDDYEYGIQYLTAEVQNDQWTWWKIIAHVSNDNTGGKWSINQTEITGEVLGRWL